MREQKLSFEAQIAKMEDTLEQRVQSILKEKDRDLEGEKMRAVKPFPATHDREARWKAGDIVCVRHQLGGSQCVTHTHTFCSRKASIQDTFTSISSASIIWFPGLEKKEGFRG